MVFVSGEAKQNIGSSFLSGLKCEALISKIKRVTLKDFVLLWIPRVISERSKLPGPNNLLERFAPGGID